MEAKIDQEFLEFYSKIYYAVQDAKQKQSIPGIMQVIDKLTGGVGLVGEQKQVSGDFGGLLEVAEKMMRRILKPNAHQQVVHSFALLISK